MKITNEQIELFKPLFCVGRMDVYGSHYLDTGRYYMVKELITDEVVRKHLEGKVPVGVFMLTGDVTSVAVADIDRPDSQLVNGVVRCSLQAGLFAYVERSKGKGHHVWMFFERPVLASSVRRCIRSVLHSLNADDLEVFPKQDRLKAGEFGNFVTCPLFGKYVEQGRTVFVDGNLNPYSDQWRFLKSIKRTPASALDSILIRLNEQSELHRNQAVPNEVHESATTVSRTFGLLPCATRMLNEGVRNMQRNAAFRLGIALKKAGLPLDATVSVLLEWAKKNKPDNGKGIITPEEIEYQVSCAYKRPYAGCGCNDAAMKPFCDPHCRLKLRTSA